MIDYWMTADGECILISDMKDSHLVNAIHFLDRRVSYFEKTISDMGWMSCQINGEIASDMIETDIEIAEEALDHTFYERRKLIDEAEARGLKWRFNTPAPTPSLEDYRNNERY